MDDNDLPLDWKQSKQLKCAYTQPIPHTYKKLSSLIALKLYQTVCYSFSLHWG